MIAQSCATRVAAISDVHGNLPALEAVLAEIEHAAVDLIVCCGDVAAGPFPVEVLERLQQSAIPVSYVRGNADREMVERFDAPRPPVAETHPGGPPDAEFKRTGYDLTAAANRIRASGYPAAEDFASSHVVQSPDPDEVSAFFEGIAIEQDRR